MKIFVFLWLVVCASAAKGEHNYVFSGVGPQSFMACGSVIENIGTFCKKTGKGYGCFCKNDNAIVTMTGCLALGGRNTSEVYDYFIEYCESMNVTLSTSILNEAYQRYLTDAVNTADIPDYNATEIVDVPLVVNNYTEVKLYNDAYKVFYGNFDLSLYVGAGGIAYWGFMGLIAMVCNWGVVIFPGAREYFNGSFSKMVRKYITLPALGRRKRSRNQHFFKGLDCLVPSRMETIMIIGFFWYLFIVCCVEIYYLKGEPLFNGREAAITRFVSDRAGIIATVLTPLLLLFGGRNNFLQWITGWNFATMITFHRWMARMIVCLAFVHSVGYTWMYLRRGVYDVKMAEDWLRWGVVAMVCGGLICVQGLLYLRRKAYELFLLIHILLAGFWVIGMWYHVSIRGYAQFMYAVFAVWGLDRLVRAIRLLWFGFPRATMTLLPDKTLKVEVPKPAHWPSIAGGHAWIHFLDPMLFWQNHPFTFIDSVDKENTIVFFCKMKKGITELFCKRLLKHPGKTKTLRVAVDGPYGAPSPVSNHSSAIYIAGGSGIPGIYSEATTMARRSKDSGRKVKLFWIVREISTVAGFLNEIQALKDLNMETVIYVTRPVTSQVEELFKSDLSSLEKEKDGIVTLLSPVEEEFPHITFHCGRPDLENLIMEEITEATTSAAFITCGHPVLVDDVRYNVVKLIDQTSKRVDFYDQLQVWA